MFLDLFGDSHTGPRPYRLTDNTSPERINSPYVFTLQRVERLFQRVERLLERLLGQTQGGGPLTLLRSAHRFMGRDSSKDGSDTEGVHRGILYPDD